MACRLRFCRKLDAEGNDLSTLAPAASLAAPPLVGLGPGPLPSERLQSSMLDQLDLDAMLRCESGHCCAAVLLRGSASCSAVLYSACCADHHARLPSSPVLRQVP